MKKRIVKPLLWVVIITLMGVNILLLNSTNTQAAREQPFYWKISVQNGYGCSEVNMYKAGCVYAGNECSSYLEMTCFHLP
jgi:hypothetical protein